MRLHARWVLPVGAPPVRDGTVCLRDEHITWVGPRHAAPPRTPGPADTERDLGDAILLPGLVNTHIHLDLAPFSGRIAPRAFFPWLRALVRALGDTDPEQLRQGAAWAVQDQLAHGVTTMADTAPNRFGFDAMRAAGVRGVAFHETFSPDPTRAPVALSTLHRAVSEMRRDASDLVRVGLSPHAPYSVSDPLYRATADYARSEGLSMAVHIAESTDESALVAAGEGAFARYLREERGIPVAPRADSPIALLDTLGVLALRPLCIHAVQASTSDVARLATHGAPVAHCPCSNAWFGHGAAPLAAFRAAGVPVGLGTDSIASNTQVRLRAEAREAADLTLTAADRLALATHGGAVALGLGDRIGRLAPGYEADLIAFPITDHAAADRDPATYVLTLPDDTPVTLALVAGRDRTVTTPVPTTAPPLP
jgi:cytosine/adenosine deaminase-related metal-dependent hydrolase